MNSIADVNDSSGKARTAQSKCNAGAVDAMRRISRLQRQWNERIAEIRSVAGRNHEHRGSFVCDLPFMLRGVGNNRVICLANRCVTDEETDALKNLVRKELRCPPLSVFITLTPAVHDFVQQESRSRPGRGIVLTMEDTDELLSAVNAREDLLRHIHEQIAYERLIPFSTSDPAEGEIFTGRNKELAQLVNGHQDYALCGAGGIGKSSLPFGCWRT